MKHPVDSLYNLDDLMGTLLPGIPLNIGNTTKPIKYAAARGNGQDWERRPGLPAASVSRGRRPAARRREVSLLTRSAP